MQGQKEYSEKLFTNFQLSERIPKDNFYRRLGEVLDLRFIRKLTKSYYGSCGQKSIDPVVCMKLMLVGMLENINSDRRLMKHCAMRMDILFFLGYDIDEPLPWHSTLSRTRSLIPKEVFESCFSEVFKLCVDAGLVSGKTQAIDSAPVKANASMDKLEKRLVDITPEEHIKAVLSNPENEDANTRDRQDTKGRGPKGGTRKTKSGKSNKTHFSPNDPDARMSTKPGKSLKLNFHAHLSVDQANHVISDAFMNFADVKDSLSLPTIVDHLHKRLTTHGLIWSNALADTNYSSGANYELLEKKNIESYIPVHGAYKGGPEGFTYHKSADYWLCPNGKPARFKGNVKKSDWPKKRYATTAADCSGCPLKAECLSAKSKYKQFTVTTYYEQYQSAIERVKSKKGAHLAKKRSSTVEPVLGSLTQFFGLQKVYSKGINSARKVLICSAMAYNLKKLLKYRCKKAETVIAELGLPQKAPALLQKRTFQAQKRLVFDFFNLISQLLRPQIRFC